MTIYLFALNNNICFYSDHMECIYVDLLGKYNYYYYYYRVILVFLIKVENFEQNKKLTCQINFVFLVYHYNTEKLR